jgi:hypothetical protein
MACCRENFTFTCITEDVAVPRRTDKVHFLLHAFLVLQIYNVIIPIHFHVLAILLPQYKHRHWRLTRVILCLSPSRQILGYQHRVPRLRPRPLLSICYNSLFTVIQWFCTNQATLVAGSVNYKHRLHTQHEVSLQADQCAVVRGHHLRSSDLRKPINEWKQTPEKRRGTNAISVKYLLH